ncbi:MAG: L,D-transpeptidase [Pseudomonadota bacterium]
MTHPALIFAACLAGAALAPSSIAKPVAKRAATSVVLDAEHVNAAGKDGGAKPDAVATLRAQILLDRAHFSSGEIDAASGANLRMAIKGFQRQRGLTVSGELDAPTWAALNADPAVALTSYTLTEADVAGPFQPIPEAMEDKAKLSALGYASVAEALGERFHINPALLLRLNPGLDQAKAGGEIVVPNVLDTEPLPKAGKIVVDRSDRTLALFDVDGKLIAQFPASSGTDKDPLPIGNWKVNGISNLPVFHYNPALFWDAKPRDKKATIPAGPNNPVGVAWIDLSKPHYGIHGTPEPKAIGKTQSHGCIRLTNWDVTALASAAGPGTDVVMQE